ncbi:Phosphatidylinositol (PI) 3-kinase [Microbotryomycetes sp. JL221]|nr:Phosphatidylinositol (PI) 3-kinase [Microbotryomycetes sp. JL221]
MAGARTANTTPQQQEQRHQHVTGSATLHATSSSSFALHSSVFESELTYLRHGDVPASVSLSVKIASLQGTIEQNTLTELLDHAALKHAASNQPMPCDLFVVVGLFSDNKPLIRPVLSTHKTFKTKHMCQWNELVALPIKLRDVPLDAQLTFTVVDILEPGRAHIVGGSTLRLFGKKHTLRKGKQRLFLWRESPADGSVSSDTPSKLELAQDEMGRLEKLVKRHERGDIVRLDWLDKLAFRQIERTHALESAKSKHLFLYVDLPRFDFPVVFGEPEYSLPVLAPLTTSVAPGQLTPAAQQSSTSTTAVLGLSDVTLLFPIADPEIVRENPVEAKYRRLVRSHRNGPLDRELKPNAKIRDELNEIVRYPPTQELTALQRDLIWQFRFYLARDKRALTKFLKSVLWTDPGEVRQAVEVLLPLWAEVEMDDALELLGPGEGFRDRRVRAYAVTQLAKADDDELMLYLLQLVQALKFEPPTGQSTQAGSIRHSRHVSASQRQSATSDDAMPSLAEFLIERSARNHVLGNHFFWYIRVECEDLQKGSLFVDVANRFTRRIIDVRGQSEMDVLQRQSQFIARLSQLAHELRTSKDARPKKIDKLRSALADSRSGLGAFEPMPHPLDAKVKIVGIDADKSSVFKSNLFPLRLHLLCESDELELGNKSSTSATEPVSYPVIFKNGDDLRQDQLVIQLFTLMDRLLRKENLDLRLMPYRVLATGAVDGMVQFVESKTLQDISNEFGGNLLGYLKAFHPEPTSTTTYGVKPEVLDTYVRSCAGYCVVTYLLGVGDRHLDNLLLSPDGHFFHVDFGYILGRDPKPYPPAVKVCKEMVDAMGGVHSQHYARFKSLCHTGFTSLRKNANLIINLVALMVDGNIPDIKLEPDKAVTKVQDKFLLDLSEEDAIKAFEALLNETSYFTSVLDRLHSVAQYWRA